VAVVALDVALHGETLQRVLGFPHVGAECRGDGADRLGVDGHLGRDPLVSLGLVGSRATACRARRGTRWHALCFPEVQNLRNRRNVAGQRRVFRFHFEARFRNLVIVRNLVEGL